MKREFNQKAAPVSVSSLMGPPAGFNVFRSDEPQAPYDSVTSHLAGHHYTEADRASPEMLRMIAGSPITLGNGQKMERPEITINKKPDTKPKL